MNNITLKSMLKEFSIKNSLSEKDSLQFEKYTSYSLLANDYYDSFEQDLVSTGDCIGVDAIAISINDILVYTLEAAKSLTLGQFDVCFNFIQAKTSSNLDLGDYLKFLQTIYVFFTGTEHDQPIELKTAYEIKTHIYQKAAKFRVLPSLRINYVYTGDGNILDSNFSTQINAAVNSIKRVDYCFSSVESRLIGGVELANFYKESLNRTTKQLMFQRHVALPKLASATAAYLGVTKCNDYIELLKNQSGNINKGAFYDNVRDYLGDSNQVNADIEKTIKSKMQRNLFSVLNNGVTLVAKKVVPSGDVFQISGFQVVNGCQTSHVLFNNKEHVTDDMYLTIKLIETDDIDLSSSVIKATNSQSLVMKEAFATIKPYHKQLEDFFKAMNSYGHRFFYERRPHQYDDDESVLNYEIVSAPLLIKSFVSVVLEEPHKVHFYYGQILKDYNNESSTLVFDESHHPGLYFVSHLLASKAKDVAIKNKLNMWSYHLALLVKIILQINLNVHDKFTDDKITKFIERINTGFAEAATQAISIIKAGSLRKNEHMIPEKTELLLESLKKQKRDMYIKASNASKVGKNTVAIKNIVEPQDSIAKLERSQLLDGRYRVKKLIVDSGVVSFNYGPTNYVLKDENSDFNGAKKAECTIIIKTGRILSITD